MPRPTIVSVVSDYGARMSPLALHHVRYYGPAVDKYILVLRAPGVTPAQYTANVGFSSGSVAFVSASQLPPFSRGGENLRGRERDHYEHLALAHFHVAEDAYVLRLDLDEFHVYPAPIREVVSRMAAQGKPAILGYFRDRLKLNGEQSRVLLTPVDGSDLGEQFPWLQGLEARLSTADGTLPFDKRVRDLERGGKLPSKDLSYRT